VVDGAFSYDEPVLVDIDTDTKRFLSQHLILFFS